MPAAERRPAIFVETLVVASALGVDLLVWGGARELRGGGALPLLTIPVVSAVVFAVLLLRWRYPAAVFGVHWVYGLAGLAVPGYGPFVGLLVALHAVARCASRRTAELALAACAVPFAVDCAEAAAQRSHQETSVWASFAVQLLLYGLLAVTVWGFARHAYEAQRRSERREDVLAEDVLRAVHQQQERVEAAVREERRRLARELHDIVGDGVTAMYLHAAGARTLADPVRVAESLALIQATGVRTMGELHRQLGLLRAADADSTDGFAQPPTLRGDLEELVARATESGVSLQTAVEGKPTDLDRSVDAAAYRVVQEALTNTVKHAGRGARARLRVSWGPMLTITVRDARGLATGPEQTALSSGLGLVGLRERVTLVGGRFEAGPVDGGFLVHAELPVAGAPDSVAAARLDLSRTS